MADERSQPDQDEVPDAKQAEEAGAPGAAVDDGALSDAPEPGEPG
jgi:hypothetical protein